MELFCQIPDGGLVARCVLMVFDIIALYFATAFAHSHSEAWHGSGFL